MHQELHVSINKTLLLIEDEQKYRTTRMKKKQDHSKKKTGQLKHEEQKFRCKGVNITVMNMKKMKWKMIMTMAIIIIVKWH